MILTLIPAAEEETHNPILPASYDILWGTVSFVIILWLFGKYVLPVFNRILTERAEKIEGGIENARAMQAEAARSRDAYADKLADAAVAASAIRNTAHEDGQQIVAEAREAAAEQAAALTARADAQITAERQAAIGALQRDVGELALTLASKIVGETLTDDERARATVDRFISELEATAGSNGGAPR